MDLDRPVSTVSGVGEIYARILKQHGIATVRDLLYFLPHRYLDYSKAIAIKDVQPGQVAVVEGSIFDIKTQTTKHRRINLLMASLSDKTGNINALWFNQPFLRKRLRIGLRIKILGPIKKDNFNDGALYFNNPDFQFELTDKLVPVYGSSSGLSNGVIAKIIHKVINEASNLIDPLPEQLLNQYKISDLVNAIRFLHSPDNYDEVKFARDRLALDELWQIMVFTKRFKVRRQDKAFAFIDTPDETN